jgi:NAD(P)H-hydrate epimerase
MHSITFPAYVLEDFPTVSAEQMQNIDNEMLNICDLTIYQMMEKAGSSIAEVASCYTSEIFPDVALLIGKGNNGGGALVTGRYLANKGARLQVILAASEDELGPVPKKQLEILRGCHPDTPVHDMSMISADNLPSMPDCDLVVDGLLGYNIHGEPREPVSTLINIANGAEVPTISVDIPSGLDPDTGEPAVPAILAAATVTLAAPKSGFQNSSAHQYLGEMYMVDIGICPGLITQIIEPELFPRDLPEILFLYSNGDAGSNGQHKESAAIEL